MWYVKGTWNGLPAWWGAFESKADAEQVASAVNGTVFSKEELHK